jgi:hypothetical protein
MHDEHSPDGVQPLSVIFPVAQSWVAQTGVACTVVLVGAAPGKPGVGLDELEDGGAFPCELCDGQPAMKSEIAIAREKRRF